MAILSSFAFLCAPSAISASRRWTDSQIHQRRGAEEAEKIEKTPPEQDSWEVIW